MLRRNSKINRERTINFLMIKWFIKFIFADHNPKIFLLNLIEVLHKKEVYTAAIVEPYCDHMSQVKE
jgi:hypothetical protein